MISDSMRGRVIWVGWAAAAVGALAVPLLYGRNIPFAEDWLLVPPLTGHEGSLLDWVFERNNEHPVAAPKALLLAVLGLSGGDVRAGMILNALLLAAAAAVLMIGARSLRDGQSRIVDVFFPLVLLHPGHWDNLVWAWQLQFVLSVALIILLLAMVVAWREGPPGPVGAAAAAAAAVLLAMSGGNGIIMAAPFAAWLIYHGLRRSRSFAGILMLAGGVAATVIVVRYLAGYERLDYYPDSPGIAATIMTTAKFAAFGFGPGARRAGVIFAAVAAAALLVALFAAAGVARKDPAERARAAALILVIAAAVAVAAVVGWGRAGKVEASGYMSTRYALLSAPALCMAFLTVELYGKPAARRWVQGALCAIVLLLLPLNAQVGLQRRSWFGSGFSQVESDLAAGRPIAEIAERNYHFLLPWNRDLLESGLVMMRDASLGPFAGARGSVSKR